VDLDDFLDGCDVDFTSEPDEDDTASLRPLFPDGTPTLQPEWEALFGA
jgi:hypothetical protein